MDNTRLSGHHYNSGLEDSSFPDQTLALLEHSLPVQFGGVTNLYYDQLRGDTQRQGTKTKETS